MRWLTWLLGVWTGLFLVLTVIGPRSLRDCAPADRTCEDGAAIGIFVNLLVWLAGFVVLSLIWCLTRHKSRPG